MSNSTFDHIGHESWCGPIIQNNKDNIRQPTTLTNPKWCGVIHPVFFFPTDSVALGVSQVPKVSPQKHSMIDRPKLIAGLRNIWSIFPYIGNNHPNWRTHIFQRSRLNPPTTKDLWYFPQPWPKPRWGWPHLKWIWCRCGKPSCWWFWQYGRMVSMG